MGMTRNIEGSGLRECGGPDWRVLGSERLNEATGRAARSGGGPVGVGHGAPEARRRRGDGGDKTERAGGARHNGEWVRVIYMLKGHAG